MHPRRAAFLPQADGSRRLNHSGLPQGKSSKAFSRLPRCTGQPWAIANGRQKKNSHAPDPKSEDSASLRSSTSYLADFCYRCEPHHAASSIGAGPAMADNLSIDRRTSALLVMDFQTLIVDNYAGGAEVLLNRTAKLIAAARTAGIRVIYVVVGFRPGYPEVSDRNAAFNGLKASGAFVAGAENAKIHFAVAPLADEIVVTKHRVSAFAGTDLDLMLRATGIETLILPGVLSSGVVLSTLCHAADADYRLLVVGDCCSDGNEEAHRALLEKVFPRHATITTAAGLTQAIWAGR